MNFYFTEKKKVVIVGNGEDCINIIDMCRMEWNEITTGLV